MEHNHVMATVKCENTATRLYDLRSRSHLKTVHDKIKDLICQDCGLAFSNKDNRSRHREKHHLKQHDHACAATSVGQGSMEAESSRGTSTFAGGGRLKCEMMALDASI